MQNENTAPSGEGGHRSNIKSGLYGLTYLSRQTDDHLSIEFLRQQYGHMPYLSVTELIRAANEQGLNARSFTLTSGIIKTLPVPCLLMMEDGEYVVLRSLGTDKVVLHRHGAEDNEVYLSALIEKAPTVVVVGGEKAGDKEFGFKWFITTMLKYRGVVRETVFASFFVQLFALVTPIFFMIIIDKVFAHNNLSTLNVLVFAMVVVVIFDVVLSGVRAYLLSHTTNRVDMELGMRLFKHMMSLPLSYFEARRTGDTIARIREVEVIRNFLTGSSLTLIIDLFFVILFIGVMFLFSAKLAWIVVASLPLFFAVSYVLTPLMRGKLEDKHEVLADNQSFLVETISGIEAIKSASVESQHQRVWETKLANYAKSSFSGTTLSNLINQVTSLISKLLTISLLYFGAHLVLSGELSVGQLIAFNMLTSRAIQPVQRLAQVWQEFTSARVSIKRVADIMNAPVEPIMLKNKTRLPKIKGQIEFNNVSFRYRDDKPVVINEVDFSVEAGEVIGVVGSTGSGKTTLVKLLQRLYVASSGKVLIDGNNIASIDGAWLRQQIGVVAQDFTLFNRSITENITLGHSEIPDEKVVEVCEMIGVHKLIASFPDGYDTILQERGLGLSTGQRQNIALARALVSDPAILILDEATSALDYESEKAFQDRFQDITKGRTTFVVAHRLSTIRHADRILTMEGGELIENASPDELLKSGGRFATLFGLHNSLWPAENQAADSTGT